MTKLNVKTTPLAEIEKDVARIAQAISGKIISSNRDELAALGIDSLTMLDLLAALEDHFDIQLNENMVREFRSIERIARVVRDTAASSDPR